MPPHPPLPARPALALALSLCLSQAVAAQEVSDLRGGIEAALAQSGAGARWGVLVRSMDSGETLYERDADVGMTPASNVKLLTSAAALHVLGPEYRFRTYVLTDGEVRDGVLHGDLVLYGTGDPGISDRFHRRRDEVFHRLADQLEEAGIHTIAGDVVGDASFFPGPARHAEWDPRDLNEHFTAGVSALSYNENVVSFRIVAGAVGESPAWETVPSPSALEVVNTARMVSSPSRPGLAILRDDPLEPVSIEGRMVAGSRDVWRQMTVARPALFAAESFRRALDERGFAVEGATRVVELPRHSVARRVTAPAAGTGTRRTRILARHLSPPLRDYLEVVNKRSHNLYAELVFRAVGRARTGVGSFEDGADAVLEALHGLGVDTTGIELRDGSGLAAGNLVPARAFVETIERMGETREWEDFWASLPRAGTRRELGRMYRTAAAGNLRAKTGTIEGVSALSGMVRSRDGERIAFSLLVNESTSQSRAKRAENVIGARLADFRRDASAMPAVPVVSVASAPATDSDRYRVARGDNLSAIATRYGVSLDDILRLNPRVQPDRLVEGEWIDLPRRTGS